MPSLLDDDFSKGIVRSVEGQRIPKGGVYDCVNGLLDDDLGIYRRGGSAYKSGSNAGSTLVGLWDGHTPAGQRTLMWSASASYVLAADDSAPTQLGTTLLQRPWSRGVALRGIALFPCDTAIGRVRAYAGSRIAAGAYQPAGVSLTVAQGSKAVTASGGTPALLANVDAGSLIEYATTTAFPQVTSVGVVASVESNTALTLVEPWAGPSGTFTMSGADPTVIVLFRGNTTFTPIAYGSSSGTTDQFTNVSSPHYLAVAGDRLVIAVGSQVRFSGRGNPDLFSEDDWHKLPAGAIATGADAIRDTVIVFTTAGVFAVTNMAYDLSDAYGNPQQSIEPVSGLVLWGDPGIVSYRGGLIVPAVDDVYLFGLDGTEDPISAAIRPLYRAYVKAGYQPGTAMVHRGHYFLPIVNGTTLVDVLVCRLDGGAPAWTRWDGHAASGAYAQRIGASTRTPALYGVKSERVVDASGCFTPASGNKSDADSTAHVLTIITRDYSVKAMVKAMWREVRARFELTDAAADNPTLTAEHAVGPVAGESWTSIGSWAEGTGEAPTRLAVGKSAQTIRFRLKTSGAAASCAVRSLEVFYRGSRKR
jgi:hypothetical protein